MELYWISADCLIIVLKDFTEKSVLKYIYLFFMLENIETFPPKRLSWNHYYCITFL